MDELQVTDGGLHSPGPTWTPQALALSGPGSDEAGPSLNASGV